VGCVLHYYTFNIGDYRRDTSHLSRIEHSIYRDLIDWYYLDESPIPKETQMVSRRLCIKTDEEAEAVKNVLSDFFVLCDDGYRHFRIDADIAKYSEKSEKNKENGKKGGRPKAAKPAETKDENHLGYSGLANANQNESESNPNQEPITNNQEPVKPSMSEKIPDKPKRHHGTDEDRTAAQYIFDKVQQVDATAKTPNMDAWSNDVRLMREQDGRTHKEICELMQWANKDEFWRANILSPGKLRQKWTQLQAKRNSPQKTSPAPVNKQTALEERNRAVAESWLRKQQEQKGGDYAAQ